MKPLIAAAGGNPDAITTALIALGGAIVGGLLTSGTQLLIHWLQGRREGAVRQREVKTAARMMQFELARAWSNLDWSIKSGEWWPTHEFTPLLTDSDRRLVIGALPADEFDTLDTAMYEIDHWDGVRTRGEPLQRQALEHARDVVALALELLSGLSGDADVEPEALKAPNKPVVEPSVNP